MLRKAQELIASLPRDPGDGGPNTVQTLLRQNSYLLAMLINSLSDREIGNGQTIALMAASIHARMQGGVKGAAIDAKTAKVLFEQVQKVLEEDAATDG